MIKSHVLYRLSYGLSPSTPALKAKAPATSSATREECPAQNAGHSTRPGANGAYGATVM